MTGFLRGPAVRSRRPTESRRSGARPLSPKYAQQLINRPPARPILVPSWRAVGGRSGRSRALLLSDLLVTVLPASIERAATNQATIYVPSVALDPTRTPIPPSSMPQPTRAGEDDLAPTKDEDILRTQPRLQTVALVVRGWMHKNWSFHPGAYQS